MRSSGLQALQCMIFIGFAIFIFGRIVKTSLESTAAKEASKTALLRMDFQGPALMHAVLPDAVAQLFAKLAAAAQLAANGGEDAGIYDAADNAQASAIASGARAAADAIRQRAALAAAEDADPSSVRIEIVDLGTHAAPAGEPEYVEARIGYAKAEAGRPLYERRIFGDQIWRAWLVPGTQSGQCRQCGAPMKMAGAHACEYCGAQTGDVVWRVLQVDATNGSNAFLARDVPYLNGRRLDEVIDSRTGFGQRRYDGGPVSVSVTSSATTTIVRDDGTTTRNAATGDLAKELDESLERMLREG